MANETRKTGTSLIYEVVYIIKGQYGKLYRATVKGNNVDEVQTTLSKQNGKKGSAVVVNVERVLKEKRSMPWSVWYENTTVDGVEVVEDYTTEDTSEDTSEG